MSILDDVRSYLTSTAGSTGLEGIIYLGRRSDTPAEQVALTETGGMRGEYVMGNTLLVMERPRFQVTSRAVTYSTARNNIALVGQLLEQCGPRTINGIFYHRIEPVQPPFLLEYDESNRPVLCQNFEVTKQRTPYVASVGGSDAAALIGSEESSAV